MQITLSQFIVWLIVGALAGSVVGMVAKRSREGFGRWINLAIGLAGAIIGGLLFRLFHIDLGLGSIQVSAEDLVAAVVGSVILLLALWGFRKYRRKRWF
ncbi:MAG: GlsB/YeaQ/YmgE family stress response membrane protein [Pirellulales bacterium]